MTFQAANRSGAAGAHARRSRWSREICALFVDVCRGEYPPDTDLRSVLSRTPVITAAFFGRDDLTPGTRETERAVASTESASGQHEAAAPDSLIASVSAGRLKDPEVDVGLKVKHSVK